MLNIQEHVKFLGTLLSESNVEDVDGWSLADLAQEEGYNFEQVLIACGVLMERKLTIGSIKTRLSLQEIDGKICIACVAIPDRSRYEMLVALFPGYSVQLTFDGRKFILTAKGPLSYDEKPVWTVQSYRARLPPKRDMTPEWAAKFLANNAGDLSPPFGPWPNLMRPPFGTK